MKIDLAVTRHFTQARANALKDLTFEAKLLLPTGWEIIFAVGWGLCVYKPNEVHIDLTTDADIPRGLPKGVRALFRASMIFYDLFGGQNEVLSNKGLSTIPERKAAQREAHEAEMSKL